LNPIPDAADRGCHRHRRRRWPFHRGWFVGVITTTIRGISHVERSVGRTTSVACRPLIWSSTSWRRAVRVGRLQHEMASADVRLW